MRYFCIVNLLLKGDSAQCHPSLEKQTEAPALQQSCCGQGQQKKKKHILAT